MNSQKPLKALAWLVCLAFVIGWASPAVAQGNDLIADLEKLTTLEGAERDSLASSVFDKIEQDTSGIVDAVLPKLEEAADDDNALIVYIAALGATGAPRTVGDICRVVGETKSDGVRSVCVKALSRIGTQEAGKCLMSVLDDVSDKDQRFLIFDALGQMKYEGALPLALEVLESDAEQDYWRPIFVFGKMGDMAVPYLLERVHDGNKDVRYNAISLLGAWLMAPEATQELEEQFWNEEDPIIRNLILSSLEKINSNHKSLIAFMKDVKSKSKDKDAKRFAEETMKLLDDMSEQMGSIKGMKDVSPEKFQKAYQEIWDSFGHDGDYQTLMLSSSQDDEPALKTLRERILQRNSDESFDDYVKVNEVISLNRVLYAQE